MAGSLRDMPADSPGQPGDPPADGAGTTTLLRVLAKERRWHKYETFKAQLERAARNLAKHEEEPGLKAVTVSARTWERWLAGQLKSEPLPDACRVLEHMFGYPVHDLLALVPGDFSSPTREQAKQATGAAPGNGPGGPATDQARSIIAPAPASPRAEPLEGTPVAGPARDGTWDVEDMERRELLRMLGSMAAVAPLAGGLSAETIRRNLDSALNAPTTKADVAEWERVAARWSTEIGPPAILLPELLTDLDEAQLRLKDAPESLRPPMARVCAYLSALAASKYINLGDERSAGRYGRTALRLIGQADDRSAQAELYADRAAWVLLQAQSSPSAALTLANDAISMGGAAPSAGIANAYAARAMALALLGDQRESTRTLRDLADTFTRMPGAQTAALSSWGYSEQQLRFVEGFVYAYAGRVSDTATALDAGLSLVPDGQWIAVTSFEVNRAVSLIRGGDPSEGARHVVRAVQKLPPGYRQSVTTRRAALALDAVPADAASMPAVTEARELLSLPPAPGLPG